jgi:hypothetical protein
MTPRRAPAREPVDLDLEQPVLVVERDVQAREAGRRREREDVTSAPAPQPPVTKAGRQRSMRAVRIGKRGRVAASASMSAAAVGLGAAKAKSTVTW